MVIVPDSKIKLIKNPLKLDNNNEMMFDSAESQYNYFTSLPKLEFDNLTYVRKDGVLRVETDSSLTYEDLLEYNFCMYQNTHFDSKWFYAFITEVNWINPSLTELKLETAYYQTWQFDLTYMDSFIEREHVDDDGIGKNTIEEGISTGEYIINSRQLIKFFNKTYYLPVIGVTELIDQNGATGIPDVYEVHGRIMNGVRYITAENTANISTLLRAYDALGKADAVQFMFMAPKELWGTSWHGVNVSFTESGETYTFTYYKLDTFDYVSGSNQDILRPTNLDGYYPKNRKMFSFPYCYLTLDSHDGNVQQFNFEDFEYPSLYDDSPTNRQIELDYTGILTPGCSIKYIPMKYKKGTGYLYSFPAMKTPMCSWVSDPYTNWLTQQAINTPFGTIDRKTGAGVASTLGVLVGAGLMATGHEYAGFKLLAGGFSGAFSNMQSDYQAQLQPNQAKGNVNSGDINFSLDLLNPEANVMSIKYDRAKSIDNFLSMYGYKVNRIGKPHLHIRTYYDYCKTNEVNIEGNLPEEDLNEIRKMFNNGIRLWHSTAKYLDFSVDNSIIETPTPETTILDTSITATGVNTNKRSYITLFGNTSQNGTPTPENPVPIQVVTGDVIVEIANSNYSQRNDYLLSLGDLEFCKIGDYQDYFYKDNGTWYLHKEIGKVVLSGGEDESWGNPRTNIFTLTGFFTYMKENNTKYYYSNNYEAYNQATANTNFQNLVTDVNYGFDLSSTTESIFTIRFKDTRYTSASDFKTWLSTHNTIVYYVLATPTNTEITDNNLIQQLNRLYTANLYSGTTNINSITSNLNPYIQLHYNI